MDRYFDGDQLLQDVSRALNEALGKHGVELYSLIGITTVMEAISSPLKLQHLQGLAGHEMGKLGQKAYYASVAPRQVALLQSPHSVIVNPMMESIVVALQRARASLDDKGLRLATYRVFTREARTTIKSAEKKNTSLAPAFSSAREYLTEGDVISRTDSGEWRLNNM